MTIDRKAFSARTCTQHILDGYKAGQDAQNKPVTKLFNPENCVRWRFCKGPDGQILTDDDGRPKYESNARIVEWEDGSRTMYVGSEVFFISEIDERFFLYEENTPDVSVLHGFVNKRIIATPKNLTSETHSALKRSQFEKYEPTRRSILTSEQQREEFKQTVLQAREKQKELRNKADRKQPSAPSDAPKMTAAFLEDDVAPAAGAAASGASPAGASPSAASPALPGPTTEGPSIADMKQAAKKARI